MHLTIRKKILAVILLLTLIAILSTSGVYYYFLVKDIRELSQKQIRIAFDMLFDDLIPIHDLNTPLIL
jgi:hypothetical protein